MDEYPEKLLSQDIPGWMGDAELDWLATRAAESKSWLEVGCLCGRSTHAVIAHMPAGSTIWVVDPFADYEDFYKPFLVTHSHPSASFAKLMRWAEKYRPGIHVNIIRQKLANCLHLLPSKVDTAFIDGNHSYDAVCEDISIVFPRANQGGLVSGHDYALCNAGVIRAVDVCFSGDAKIVPGTSIWTYRVP